MDPRRALRAALMLAGSMYFGLLGFGCQKSTDGHPEGADAPAAESAPEADAVNAEAAGPGSDTSQDANPDSPSPEQTAVDFWRFETGGEVWSRPVIQDGVVFAGSDDRHLYALDLERGEKLWSAGPLPAAVRSKAVLDSERLAVLDQNGGIHAFSLGGEALWKREVKGAFSPAFDGGGIFVITSAGELLRLDAKDGRVAWRLDLGAPAAGAPEAAGGRVVVTTADGFLYAVQAAEGRLLWRRSVGSGAASRLAGGTVYAAGGGFLWAFRAVDGAERWRLWASEFLAAPPALAGDVLLAAAGDGSLWAIDAEKGFELWRHDLGAPLRAAPAISGGAAFLATGEHLFLAYDKAKGGEVWRFTTDARLTRSLAVVPGRLVFGAQDGAIYGMALDLPGSFPEAQGEVSRQEASRRAAPAFQATPSFHDQPPRWRQTLELPGPGVAVQSSFARSYALGGSELIARDDDRELWRSAASSAATFLDDATLVVAEENELKRLDSKGRELWRVDMQAVPAEPAGSSLLIVGDDAGRLSAFGARDGQRRWRQSLPGPMRAAAALGENLAVAGICPGGLVALDRLSGRELWRYDGADCVSPSPLIMGETVYAVAATGEVIAIDIAVGGLRWSAPLGGGGRFAPVSYFGMLHVATDDGVLHALDLGDGLEAWRAEIGPRPSTAPALLDGIAHIGSHDGRLYAINALNGDRLWHLEIGSTVMDIAIETGPGTRALHLVTLDRRWLIFDLP